MAHFAKLDANNVVTQVIVVSNDDTSDSNGTEVESIGVAFCQKLLGATTNWKQTSYNSKIRGNYAGIGMTYMSNVATLGVGSTDIFIDPQPHASWSIDATTPVWKSPVGDMPGITTAQRDAGQYYTWDESAYQGDTNDPKTLGWTLVTP
tara:strand:+ start:1851 stop:2297 length:447 start_codon:yes stop_codon:yes gene_type:complete